MHEMQTRLKNIFIEKRIAGEYLRKFLSLYLKKFLAIKEL